MRSGARSAVMFTTWLRLPRATSHPGPSRIGQLAHHQLGLRHALMELAHIQLPHRPTSALMQLDAAPQLLHFSLKVNHDLG